MGDNSVRRMEPLYPRARPSHPPRLRGWQQVLADALDQNIAIGVRAAVADHVGRPPPELSSTPRAERLTFSPRWAVPACSMYQAPMPTTMQVIATTEGWPLPAVTLRRQGRAQPCADRRDRVGYERGIPRGRALTLTNELKALESSPEGFHIQ